jgi:hypothetical protein
VAYTTLSALDTRPAQADVLALDPTGVFALFLLPGLVQHRHRMRIVIDAQMLGDEPGHDAHRRLFVPHRVVEQPLRLVRGGIAGPLGDLPAVLRGISAVNARTYLPACNLGSRRANTAPTRPSNSSRWLDANSPAATMHAAAVSYSS